MVIQMDDLLDDNPVLQNPNVSSIIWTAYPGQDSGPAIFDALSGLVPPHNSSLSKLPNLGTYRRHFLSRLVPVAANRSKGSEQKPEDIGSRHSRLCPRYPTNQVAAHTRVKNIVSRETRSTTVAQFRRPGACVRPM